MRLAALVVPGLLLLFVSQLLGAGLRGGLRTGPAAVGLPSVWSAPAWGYVTPTAFHGLARFFHYDAYSAAKYSVVESASYLGVATLALMLYAAIHRVGFRGAAYWWSAFLILVVLSLGAYATFGPYRVGLPSLWLWKHVFAFCAILAPFLFNLLATIFAAVLAAAGLRHLLARVSSRGIRTAVYGLLIVLTVADLAVVPYATATLPGDVLVCYEMLKERDPEMSLLELPLYVSGNAHNLNAICGYWQSFHRGRTTGGYSSLDNVPFDNQLVHNSPFSTFAMMDEGYLSAPDAASFGIVKDIAFGDYAWLYLTVHHLNYIVLHQWPGAVPEDPAGVERLKALLAGAKIFEDRMTAVYDRRLLKSPARPVLTRTERMAGRLARPRASRLPQARGLVVYNPPHRRRC